MSNQHDVKFSHMRHLFAIIGEFDFCHHRNCPAMAGYLKAQVKLNTLRYNFHTQCIFLCQSQFAICKWDLLSSVCWCLMDVCAQFLDIVLHWKGALSHTYCTFFLQESVMSVICVSNEICVQATPNLCGRTGFLDKLQGNREAGAKVMRTIKSLPPCHIKCLS